MFVGYHLCKSLFSLTWENAGSGSWVFTVLDSQERLPQVWWSICKLSLLYLVCLNTADICLPCCLVSDVKYDQKGHFNVIYTVVLP